MKEKTSPENSSIYQLIQKRSSGKNKSDKSLQDTSVSEIMNENEDKKLDSCYAVRIKVSAVNKYRICTSNPQGNSEDTWSEIDGNFNQHFFLIGRYGFLDNCLLMSDGLVVISRIK